MSDRGVNGRAEIYRSPQGNIKNYYCSLGLIFHEYENPDINFCNNGYGDCLCNLDSVVTSICNYLFFISGLHRRTFSNGIYHTERYQQFKWQDIR